MRNSFSPGRVTSFLLLLVLSLHLAVPCSATSLTTRSHDFAWLPWFCDHHVHQAKLSTDMQKLKDYDIVVIIDKSHSMLVADCQPPQAAPNSAPISRWQWCRREILDIARQSVGVLPQHFRVVTFSDDYSVYDNVDPPGVDMIFAENTPSGPTHAEHALKGQLDAYFQRRTELGDKAKPLLIAMITDGCPDNPSAFKYEIATAANQMNYVGEVKITLLQVGHDVRATKLLSDLNSLAQHDAKYDIVKTQSFEQVQQAGLVRSLADAVAPNAAAVPHNRAYGAGLIQ